MEITNADSNFVQNIEAVLNYHVLLSISRLLLKLQFVFNKLFEEPYLHQNLYFFFVISSEPYIIFFIF
jgi:hypothetical protein